MIVEVLVDGQQWDGEKLESATHGAATAGEIRMTSADPIALVCQTFSDAFRALSDADRLQQKSAELLQSDEIPAAMERLQEAISIWLSVQQALVMGLELAEIDLETEWKKSEVRSQRSEVMGQKSEGGDSLRMSGQGDLTSYLCPLTSASFKSMIDELNGHLRRMHDSLEAKDTSALADTLLYELPPVVRSWQDLLDDLQARLTDGAGEGEIA